MGIDCLMFDFESFRFGERVSVCQTFTVLIQRVKGFRYKLTRPRVVVVRELYVVTEGPGRRDVNLDSHNPTKVSRVDSRLCKLSSVPIRPFQVGQ